MHTGHEFVTGYKFSAKSRISKASDEKKVRPGGSWSYPHLLQIRAVRGASMGFRMDIGGLSLASASVEYSRALDVGIDHCKPMHWHPRRISACARRSLVSNLMPKKPEEAGISSVEIVKKF